MCRGTKRGTSGATRSSHSVTSAFRITALASTRSSAPTTSCCANTPSGPWRSGKRGSRKVERRSAGLGSGAQARDAELVRKLAGAVGDRVPHLLGLEQNRVAALREDLADQPFRAADGHLCERGAVLEGRRPALGRPACRDAFQAEHLRAPRITQPSRPEGGPPL